MVYQLPQELADILKSGDLEALEVVDPNSNRIYFIVAAETHRLAMEALRRLSEREAISEGIAQMEAGEGITLEEARRQSREKLLNRHR